MPSEHSVILLVGSDPDVLFLRSAVLSSAGIWNMRVQNANQAIEILGTVPCHLAAICYTLNEADQQQLQSYLLEAHPSTRIVWMVPGDDCSGTGFLMKIEDALAEPSPLPFFLTQELTASRV